MRGSGRTREKRPSPQGPGWTLGASAAVLLLAASVLFAMGRVWWCACGSLSPWSWKVHSQHNSQHLIDPYTFSHVLHGLLFYWFTSGVLRNRPLGLRLVLALVAEAGWEIFENTDFLIERYRAATISLNYFGDSIANSLSDIIACAAGFLAAAVAPVRLSVAAFWAVELGMLLWIRDSLLLNVLMLIYPIDAIRIWQSAL